MKKYNFIFCGMMAISLSICANIAIAGNYFSQIYDLSNPIWQGTLAVGKGGTGTTTSTGTGSVVLSSSPSLSTPSIGAATGTSLTTSGNLITTSGFVAQSNGTATTYMGAGTDLIAGAAATDSAIRADGASLIFGIGSTRVGAISSSGYSVIGEISTTSSYKVNNSILCSSTAPTVSGFGTSPSVPANNGTCAFTVNVGTGGVASTGTVNLPAAANGWVCNAQNVTTPAMYITSQTGGTTTTATFTNYSRTTGLATAWTASDVLRVSCMGY